MRAVVLVAGYAKRLFPITESIPKCLLEVGTKTIFDYQMEALKSVGIREVCLVVGYRREQIVEHARARHGDLDFTFTINHHFYDTNTCYSLWLAGDYFLGRDFVYMNGDVLFDPRLLLRVVERDDLPAGLAVEKKPCGDEEVKVIAGQHGRVMRIGKLLPHGESIGEFIGVARFGAEISKPFFTTLDTLVKEGHRNAYFEAALDRIADDHAMHVVDVTDLPVIEIDFPEDYEAAKREVLARFPD